MVKRNFPRSSATRNRARRVLAGRREACHICGRPIDYLLPSSDPMSFVVDHVKALANGGEDALPNMRAAHRHISRDCNSKKRARDHAPIIRRSGALE